MSKKMIDTTLCYIEKDNSYLLLHRTKKKNDVNKDKWIGVGGKVEKGESVEECLLREVKEEVGLTLLSYECRAEIIFDSDAYPLERMYLFTSNEFSGELSTCCDEGVPVFVDKDKIFSLPIWEGDKIFLNLLKENHPFFHLELKYKGDTLVKAILDGKELELNNHA